MQKDAPAVESPLPWSACIIDDIAMVQRLKGDQKTFKELTEMLLAMALHEGGSSTRIFDNYLEISIKNLEREKRGAEMGATYRSIRPDYRVQKWRHFLSNTENKQRLIPFIRDLKIPRRDELGRLPEKKNIYSTGHAHDNSRIISPPSSSRRGRVISPVLPSYRKREYFALLCLGKCSNRTYFQLS